MPFAITLIWLNDGAIPLWTRSISVLIFWIKLLMLLRPFEYFGIYIAIIIGVARQVFSFLLVLGMVVVGYAHAFFILLKPNPGTSISIPPGPGDDDPNNPWKLTTAFNAMNADGNIAPQSAFLQSPDDNTNVYSHFGTALWGTYMVLTGMNF